MTTTGYGVLPTPAELKSMIDRGMTRQQIVDEVHEKTGYHVSRSAVSMALKRAGLNRPPRRYEQEIPWRVAQRHERHYALAMLRALARRRRGLTMSDHTSARLDSWLERLDTLEFPDGSRGAVVVYWPDTERGFQYVPRRPSDRDVVRPPAEDEGFLIHGGELDD